MALYLPVLSVVQVNHGKTFNLVDDWEEKQSLQEEELYLASLPSLEDLKIDLIKKLHQSYDDKFQRYLDGYPKAEQKSFMTKAQEASAYMADNTISTPYIAGLVKGDDEKRIKLIHVIWEKVKMSALNEGDLIGKRDAMKACETIEELEALDSTGEET